MSTWRPSRPRNARPCRPCAAPSRRPPSATEGISYGIPGYQHKGNLVSFVAFKNHLTFFAGRAINRKFSKELERFEQTKGGIHFTPEKPIPASLITRMVKWRVRENEAHARAKT